jgi:transcriptional regulator with XRE-family HTH domain
MGGRGKANEIDRRVGNRLRLRRTALGISQEKVGRQVKLAFQQVQKWENGTNRISAAHLYLLSLFLRVPVSYFFESGDLDRLDVPPRMQRNLMNRDGLSLWRAFARISDQQLRERLIGLVKAMAARSRA